MKTLTLCMTALVRVSLGCKQRSYNAVSDTGRANETDFDLPEDPNPDSSFP